MKDIEIAKALGKQVALNKPLSCPLCSPDAMDGEQPMSSVGDYEDELFCPHCEMSVELRVTCNPSEKKKE